MTDAQWERLFYRIDILVRYGDDSQGDFPEWTEGYDCGAAVMAGGVQVTDVASGDGNGGTKTGGICLLRRLDRRNEAVELRPRRLAIHPAALVSAVEAVTRTGRGARQGKDRPRPWCTTARITSTIMIEVRL